MSRKEGQAVTSEGIRIDGLYAGPEGTFPYEGPALNIKHDDPPHMLPRLRATITVETFWTEDPDDMTKYKKYMEDVARGWAIVSKEDIKWVPGKETWKIFLRLMHMKYIEPEDTSRAEN